jgi:SAM-dependent methyltransferase
LISGDAPWPNVRKESSSSKARQNRVMAQDSSRPDFWDSRYRGGTTPGTRAACRRTSSPGSRRKRPSQVLVPGCGSGYEVKAFAEHGHDVLGIDISDAGLERARRLTNRVRKADFFQLDEDFDLVYERTFLCALPRRLWPDWARKVAEVVRPGGRLAGFFYLNDNERGPPFGTSPRELDELLKGAFVKEEDEKIPLGNRCRC